MLSIGELDRRIIIQSPTQTKDAYGDSISTWATAYTVWAKIEWKKSDRDEESQELVNTTDVIFYIRNLGVTIKSTYRIEWEDAIYQINGIKQIDGRVRFLELETKVKDNKDT